MAEVVQDAQQDWTVGIRAERAHSQAAEARAEHAEAALEVAQAAASQMDAGSDGRLPVSTTGSAEPHEGSLCFVSGLAPGRCSARSVPDWSWSLVGRVVGA